jgi:hypothetical protein
MSGRSRLAVMVWCVFASACAWAPARADEFADAPTPAEAPVDVSVDVPANAAAAGKLQEPDVATGERLLAEGDALADEGKYDAAVLKYMDAYEALLPSMRKLPFKRDVKGHFTPRKNMPAMVEQMFAEEVKPEEMRADELAMKALGLIPRDMDLKATMVRLMSEEMAGFYDSKKETMHLIHEELAPPRPKGQKPGLWERLFGDPDKGRFDKEQSKQVLAHELTHALADQNFDLDALREAAEGDGDREMAAVALIEGEAMLTMTGAAAEDWEGTTTASIPAGPLEVQMNVMSSMAGALGGPAMRDVPPVLRETLIFPYTKGLIFVAHQTNAGGWRALDWAYAHPPLSTEQILHPEKYGGGAKADPPTAIDLGELPAGDGWTELDRDTLGELVIGIMLAKHGGRPAAAGWDGDAAATFEGPGGKLGLVWLSTWDTAADAREFARGYAAFQPTKFASPTPAAAPPADAEGAEQPPDEQPDADAKDADDELNAGEPEAADADAQNADEAPAGPPAGVFPPDGGDAAVRRRIPDQDDALLHIEVRGSDVLVVEGFPAAVTDALVKGAFEAKKSEKTHKSKPPRAPGKDAEDDD